MKELGLTEKDLSDLLEQEKLGKNIPDFKIVGNKKTRQHDWRGSVLKIYSF